MDSVRYDDEKHEYYLGRKRLGGITEVLKVSGIQRENNFVSDHDLYVGSASHKVIELYIKGTLDFSSVDTQLVPRLEAYIKFEKATGFKAATSEEKVYSEMLGIASRIDLTGFFPDGSYGIVELKGGAIDYVTAIQTALQRLCLDMGKKIIRRFGLKIGKDGKPNLIEFTNPRDVVVAMSAVTIYNWLRNNGGIK